MCIETALKELIVNIVNQDIDVELIDENTNLIKEFKFDSILIIELVVAIETRFHIIIEDEDLNIEKLTMFKSLCKIVAEKLSCTVNV